MSLSASSAGALPAVAAPTSRPRGRSGLLWRLWRSRAAVLGGGLSITLVLCGLLAPILTPYDPTLQNISQVLLPPSPAHPLGTDDLGRDLLARLLYGANITLTISLLAVLLALAAGAILGTAAAHYGGRVDDVIMRLMDILLAMPGVLLAITVISILGPGIENVVVAIAVYSIPTFARLARASALSVREQDFVLAARALGAGDARLMAFHILPNITAPLIVQTSLRVATAILTASGLSFLGLGVQPPTPEWGAMLSNGRNYLTNNPHVAVSPGLAIMLAVLGFNLLGDGLRDALDPRLKS